MDAHSLLTGVFGGALIGAAAGALLILNGRIAGISGIYGGALTPRRGDALWRVLFVAGLLLGGVMLWIATPNRLPIDHDAPTALLIASGLLVGFGTRMGSGCTSGHGVCGMSRLSPRSLIATPTFIAVGAVTVIITKQVV